MRQQQVDLEELEDLVTAHREAGLAVAAQCLNQVNYGATILPNGDVVGSAIKDTPLIGVKFEWERPDNATARALKGIVICLGGVVAQVRVRGSSCRPWHFDGDYDGAYKMRDRHLSLEGKDRCSAA